MSYWHAHAEKNGKRVAGSDLDAIEANSAESAARRATRYFWIERPELFEHLDGNVREITVAIGTHLSAHPDTDTTTPTPIGELSRWTGSVLVKSTAVDFGAYFDANDSFNGTEAVEIQVAPVRR